MIADGTTILWMSLAVTLGILLFDLYLLLFNKGWTISRSVVRARPWVQILICALICALIAHFWVF